MYCRKVAFLASAAVVVVCVVLIPVIAAVTPDVSRRETVEVKITTPASTEKPIPVVAVPASKFTVTLASNPTTGYKWRLGNQPDKNVVTFLESRFNAPEEAMPGRGGTESWSFAAVRQGKTTIVLEYVRPWEKDTEPEKTQTFDVTVL